MCEGGPLGPEVCVCVYACTFSKGNRSTKDIPVDRADFSREFHHPGLGSIS
jgi:hypothetical protein